MLRVVDGGAFQRETADSLLSGAARGTRVDVFRIIRQCRCANRLAGFADAAMCVGHDSIALTHIDFLVLSDWFHLLQSPPVSSRWNYYLSYRHVNIQRNLVRTQAHMTLASHLLVVGRLRAQYAACGVQGQALVALLASEVARANLLFDHEVCIGRVVLGQDRAASNRGKVAKRLGTMLESALAARVLACKFLHLLVSLPRDELQLLGPEKLGFLCAEHLLSSHVDDS